MTTNNLPEPLRHEKITELTRGWLSLLPSPAPVNSFNDYELFARARAEVKQKRKELDKRRKDFTAPLDEQKKAIINYFDQGLKQLEVRDKAYLSNLMAWDEKQQMERDRKQAELENYLREQEALKAIKQEDEKKAEAILTGAEAVAVPQLAPAKPLPGSGMSYRQYWKFRVVDASKVPDEFWMIDENKLAKLATTLKEQAQVSGVEFFAETIPVQRTC